MCEPASSVLRKVDVKGVLTQDDVLVMQKFQHTLATGANTVICNSHMHRGLENN